MADGLKVDFAEIDRMVTGLTNLNAYALPLVPKVGALSADGDLLASAILSPGTAIAAEGAVLSASAQLGVTMVTTEALVVITASIVKVYEAAETAIAAAAAAIEVGVGVAVKIADRMAMDVVLVVRTAVYVTAAASTFAGEAIGSGLVGDAVGSAANALSDALSTAVHSDGSLADRLHAFTSAAGENFMAALSALSPKIVAVEQNTLGDLRESGSYDDLLGTLIADGHRLGLFDDGVAPFGEYYGHDVTDPRAIASAGRSGQALFKDQKHFTTDENGHIVPTDLTSLMASAAQIDSIGKDPVTAENQFADIRVIKNIDRAGNVSFTVQIPSTQSWSPIAGDGPNDLTADVLAMQYGDQTALADAVRAALAEQKVGHAPVMLVGFSLGGITAGTIAADPGDLNIQQVVTAGAPIGAMHIPSSTSVTTLESSSDPVAALDGTPNPENWNNITGPAPTLHGEHGAPNVGTAHSAVRYGQMAEDARSRGATQPGIDAFLGGEKTVTDYQARR